MQLKKTISTIFLVPTLKIGREELLGNGFINGYLWDVNREKDEDSIYLLFKPKNLDSFEDFLEMEYSRKNSTLYEEFDYDGGFIVLTYKLNKEYSDDFEKVKKGMYSKTSKDFQNIFPKIVKIKKRGEMIDEVSLQHRVFTKSPNLKEYWEDKIVTDFTEDMEVWDGFDEKNETLDIERIKQLI